MTVWRRLSIRAILTLVVNAIGLFTVLLSGSAAYDAWQSMVAAEKITTATIVSRQLFDGLANLRSERGTVMSLLNVAGPAADEAWNSRVLTAREAGETAYQAVMAPLARLEINGLAPAIQTMRAAHDTVADLRAKVDAARRLPREARDAALLTAWPAAGQDYLDAIAAVMSLVDSSLGRNDARVGYDLGIKNAAWSLRVAIGSLGSRLGVAVAANRAWTADEALAAAADYGQAQLAWDWLTAVAAQPDTPAALVAAINAAAANFHGPAADRQRAMIAALNHGQATDIPLADLQRDNVVNQALIVDVAQAAMQLMIDHARQQAARARAALIVNLAVLLLTAALSLSCVLVIHRRVIKPILAMTSAMQKLAAHNLAVEIPPTALDEVGAMAGAVQVFKNAMIEADRLVASQAAENAAKARRQAVMDQHTQDFGASVSGVMASLANAAAGMRQAADAMSNAASAVHEQAAATASGAGQSSQDLTTVAAAVEQMTASIEEIARQVAAAAAVAREAVQQAETGQVSIMGLAEATSRIGDVVGLINRIAGQTNLLALNATIEAVQAGEAGTGFAVVAGEVKALAAQTAKATADISSQIQGIQSATDEAIEAVVRIGTVIGRMEQVSSAIAAAVEEQSVTTRSIARSVQAVTVAIDGAAQAMGEVVANADQAGEVSQSVQLGADDINQQASNLRIEVDQFLQAIRTDAGDRRQYERLDGGGALVMLQIRGRPAEQVDLGDISRGGAAVGYKGQVPAGTEVTVTIPGDRVPLSGRVVRTTEKGMLAIVFNHDSTTHERVDQAMARLRTRQAA